jgi:hypothetical protein
MPYKSLFSPVLITAPVDRILTPLPPLFLNYLPVKFHATSKLSPVLVLIVALTVGSVEGYICRASQIFVSIVPFLLLLHRPSSLSPTYARAHCLPRCHLWLSADSCTSHHLHPHHYTFELVADLDADAPLLTPNLSPFRTHTDLAPYSA